MNELYHRICKLKSCRKPFTTKYPVKEYCSPQCQMEMGRIRANMKPDEAPGKPYPRKPWRSMAEYCGQTKLNHHGR
jgi:hypothetical protein